MSKNIFTILLLCLCSSIVAQQKNFSQGNDISRRIGRTSSKFISNNKGVDIPHTKYFLSNPTRRVINEDNRESQSTDGTEFWLTFMCNEGFYLKDAALITTQIIIAANENTTVTVTNPQTGWSSSTNVDGNSIGTIIIPLAQCYNNNSECINNTGLLVTSTKKISLYSSNHSDNTYDAANIYPTQILGTQYIVQSYGNTGWYSTEFAIVATQDNTIVNITPSTHTDTGRTPNQPFSVTLQQGQVFQVTSGIVVAAETEGDDDMLPYAYDLTGSTIVSNKPIAVFHGNPGCYIPRNTCASDHVYEEAIPVNAWGTEYILTGTLTMVLDQAIVVASTDNSDIWINGTKKCTLNRGQSYLFDITNGATYVKSNNPISCCQYITGGAANNDMGDPSMITMTPIQQRINAITFGTFQTSYTQKHYINIVAHDTVINSVKLDNVNIASKFNNVPNNTEYNFARIEINHGTHSLESNGGVTAHIYGLGEYESYAYNVGSSMKRINNIDMGGLQRDSFYYNMEYCEDELPVTIGNLVIRDGGHYLDSVVEGNHTTIYEADVKVHHAFDSVRYVTLNKWQSVYWNEVDTLIEEISYSPFKKCWYFDNGCDSCYTLYIYLDMEQFDTICNTHTYYVETELLHIPDMTGRSFIDTTFVVFPNEQTKVTKHIHIKNKDFLVRYIHDTICNGQTYYYEGRPVAPGNHTYYKESPFGCDSTIYLSLVNNSSLIVEEKLVCEDQVFEWRGKIFQGPGIYYDSLVSKFGCDSVYRLNANLNPTRYQTSYVDFCWGDTIIVRDLQVTRDTTLVDTLISSYGCDSVLTTVVRSHPSYRFAEVGHICEGETYLWRGLHYVEDGTYYERHLTNTGCDSIYELRLHVHPHYFFHEHATICYGKQYTWHHHTYSQQGIYYDSLQTTTGCDSIYQLILTILPTHLIMDTLDICQGGYADYHGHKWNTPGLHYDSLQTYGCGCDSVYQVLVRVHPIQTSTEKYIAQEYQPYRWHDREYDLEGTYRDTIQSSWGCDSICVLQLSICRAITSTEEASICSHDKYLWRGQYYNTNGTFYSTKRGQNSCDSTFQLILHVTPTQYNITNDSTCNQHYVWRGNEYIQSGTYSDTIYDPTRNNCVINLLNLQVKQPTIPSNVVVQPVCSNDPYLEISYSYQGTKPIHYSIIFDSHAQARGFKNVVDSLVNGPIASAALPKYINGEYIRPDVYHADFILNNGTCDGSLHHQPIDIVIRYPNSILQQNWNDVVAVVNDKLNGGYQFSQYAWFVNNHSVEGNKSYLYQPDSWRPGDMVWANLTRIGETYAIPTCPITIQSYANTYPYPVEISYAKQSARKMVQIKSTEAAHYSLYNLQGALITQGEIGPEQPTTLYLSDLNAVYVLHVQTTETQTLVTKKISF